MKYVKNNRADEFGTFTQLDGIMKCSAAIATNTALKVAGDERYNGRIAARARLRADRLLRVDARGVRRGGPQEGPRGRARVTRHGGPLDLAREDGFVRTSGNF